MKKKEKYITFKKKNIYKELLKSWTKGKLLE